MMNQEEIEDVAKLFKNLGAEEKQAEIMAKQLLKRADQLARERNSSKTEELQKLLEVSICGAQGMLKPSSDTDLAR